MKPTGRKSVKGLADVWAADCCVLMERIRDATEEFDAKKLEELLREATAKDMDKNDLTASRLVFQQLQSEAFVLEALEEAQRDSDSGDSSKTLKRLQNLSAQILALSGDEEKTRGARQTAAVSAAQAQRDGENTDLSDFKLSEYSGLKASRCWQGHRRSVAPSMKERRTVKADGSMLTHSKVTIAEALTQVPSECEELAVQNFRDILMCMADRPAQPTQRQAAQDAIISLVRNKNELCDEIYLQVLKQLNENPSARSEKLGWQLLDLLCLSTSPSDEAILYVKAFLHTAATTKAEDTATTEEKQTVQTRRDWAEKCIKALDGFDTLPRMNGHIWKKSPKILRFGAKDWRYFKIRNMQFYWWKTLEDSEAPEAASADGGPRCKGYINFLANECEVIPDEGNQTGFSMRALGGTWNKDAVFNARGKTREKRVFMFDTSGSEHNREAWLTALSAHLQRADALRSKKDLQDFDDAERRQSGTSSLAAKAASEEVTPDAPVRWQSAADLSTPKAGEKVYYKCQTNLLPDGSKLVYGCQGEVSAVSDEGRVTMKFEGIAYNISCACNELSREPPPATLAGGWKVGSVTWYKGPLNELDDGTQLWYGTEGEVSGPSTLRDGEDYQRIAVMFEDVPNPVSCFLDEVSWDKPSTTLCGDWKVGDDAWYKGQYNAFDDGSKLVYGLKGQIVGPDKEDNSRLMVKFWGIEFFVAAYASDLLTEPPKETRLPVADNWKSGDKAYYKGVVVHMPAGGQLSRGMEVEVATRSTESSDPDAAEKVSVRFFGQLLNVAVSDLSASST